jgi:ribosome-binding protein aMBF1 (putative translation factor)
MKSCGDTNAWWDPPSLTETLCFEMAEDFVQLYNGYTEKNTTSKKKMQLNELIARNIKRIRLAHKMSMGSLASSAGMTEAWVGRVERGLESSTVDQLEKLALALKVETAEFFMAPANKPKSAEAKSRTPK